ncbi:MAG TPA: head-tail connector protein [Methylophilaceae bacterium]|nr:head-tail connector protein [Methylophilaceae bacterium]
MIIVITPPASEPVTLAEAKLHCKADSGDDDSLISIYITAARAAAEHRIGRALVTQTLELVLDSFPGNEIELPHVPVASITSVKYLDSDGIEQTIAGSDYYLDNAGLKNWVIPGHGTSWPSSFDAANAVRVRYVAGYGDETKVPGGIKSWILLTVGTLYKNRESTIDGTITSPIPERFYESLLDPYKTWSM